LDARDIPGDCQTPKAPAILLPSSPPREAELGRWLVDIAYLPKCQKCKIGDLVPLSDFGSQGAPIHFKAWACTNPDCGFNIKIRNGDLYIDEPIADGTLHTPRIR